jgi:pyruvate dehydrogenase E1 component beta subunit
MQVDAAAAETASGRIEMTYRDAVCAALEDEMNSDATVVLLGEDVANGGGVFKTNVGLPERFPGRVLNTPICENTFVGAAIGMATTGLRPVVEIMFSDFLPTAADAIIEELAKFRFMSGGRASAAVTIRSIGGAGGRFGTQHSATGESWLMGFPGLHVATASSPAAAYGLLRAAIQSEDPVVVFEHKALYGQKGLVLRDASGIATIGEATIERPGSDVTIVATMLMASRALEAAGILASEGIDAEVIDLRWLRPLDLEKVQTSVEMTGRLVVAEEQVRQAGWGATLMAEMTMRGLRWQAPPMSVSLPDDVLIPYSPPLEDLVVPSVSRIADAVRATVSR